MLNEQGLGATHGVGNCKQDSPPLCNRNTHTHTHTHTHTLTYSLPLPLFHILSQTHILSHTNNSHMLSLTLTTHKTLTHTYTLSLKHTRTSSLTFLHSLSPLSLSLSVPLSLSHTLNMNTPVLVLMCDIQHDQQLTHVFLSFLNAPHPTPIPPRQSGCTRCV
jgi:hypothetical protein